MKTAMQIENYTKDNATHLLMCRHCIGRNCKEYRMDCIPLSESKNGKVKVLVFGERNWSGKDDVKRVRYVESDRVIKMIKQ